MDLLSLQSESPVPERLVWTSVALTLLVVGEVAVRVTTVWSAPQVVLNGEFVIGVVTTAPFVAGIGYAGYWLAASDVDAPRHRRVWWWLLIGAAASLLLNLAILAVVPVSSGLLAVGWLRWAVAVGGGIGVGVGITEARAIQKALEAERSAVRAEQLAVQRDLLDYLNSLLRHEVLNATNVISGYGSLLMAEHDEGTPGYEYSETITRKSDEVTTVIEDVRVLLHATEGRRTTEPVDVVDVLDSELEKLADLDPAVVVDLDAPDSVTVPADALLPRVFGNLLSNAVVHNDSTPPRVSVTVETSEDTVVVDVADNGPGIPDAEAETLFERPVERTAEHGLGLYLVGQLVDHYGGRVQLLDTGPDGSVFRVELPRESGVTLDGATGAPDDQPGNSFSGAATATPVE
ncbi:sensor histidine kinase [Halobacterium bonnevillei]|uniref:histidine kinase n=1 Tax=Halobacterium bonnevillei TaxID=2692200 RepID=A0A6B0SQA5_9EURY|nr:HAMP domain-containing sensor histidine kinase [Halobacterium bonnevillei]MXR21713.1 GHKL domain-containing protein [Halobacterium bonnevillei]